MREYKELNFENQDIFVGIDVHKKSWTVTILTEELEHGKFNQPPIVEILVNYLHRNFPKANYYCAYEAGYSGFWVCEKLNSLGVNCIVVNPADVPTSDKDKRHKNDKRDSRKIAKSLRASELEAIYVPNANDLSDRQLVRTRFQLVKDQTRIKNQIKGLLAFHGINIPEEFSGNRRWSNKFIKWLLELKITHQTLKKVLEFHISRLIFYRKMLSEVTKEIRKLAYTEKYRENYLYLKSIPGIGSFSAMVWLLELIDINRFNRDDKLTSYVGLIPGERSSGSQDNFTGITYRRNIYLRYIIIENAWFALRKDPALMMYYNQLTKTMKGIDAIVKVARKLLRRIYYVLKKKRYYIKGIIE
jgi:transposase